MFGAIFWRLLKLSFRTFAIEEANSLLNRVSRSANKPSTLLFQLGALFQTVCYIRHVEWNVGLGKLNSFQNITEPASQFYNILAQEVIGLLQKYPKLQYRLLYLVIIHKNRTFIDLKWIKNFFIRLFIFSFGYPES